LAAAKQLAIVRYVLTAHLLDGAALSASRTTCRRHLKAFGQRLGDAQIELGEPAAAQMAN
jgi:hypothetical protein